MKKIRSQCKRKVHNIIKRAVLPGLCLAAFLCAGCSFPSTALPESEGNRVSSMESTPVVDYVVPKLVPNVLVDVTGYRSEGYKRAAVKGRKLPKTFNLVDAQTGEIVFTGALERGEYSADQGLYSAYADFHEWEQEGSYYLECEYVGRSYTFTLEAGLYDRLFAEVCQELMAACREQTVTLKDINRILLAYEWYGEVFADDNGDTIPDALDAVADWIEATGEQPVPEGQEAAYAAVLAKFSFLYQKYDRQYATECLKRASVVFGQTQSVMQEDAESFHALTELYRATGLYTYRSQIEPYKTYFENQTSFAEADGYLYGAMTYINTRQPVDRELCKIFMDSIMAQGESISELYGELLHPVTAHNNGASDLLRHAWELACANYVMNNYQYNHVMEEFLHYLRGRNALSVDFYVQDTEELSGYLVILTQLLAVQDNLNE